MIIEFLDSIHRAWNAFRERLQNPLICAFLISWIATNWRIVLIVVFSDYPLVERFGLIDGLYRNGWGVALDWTWRLGGPLLVSFAYVLAMPRILLWIDRKRLKPTEDRRSELLTSEIAFAKERLDLLKVRRDERELIVSVEDLERRESELVQLRANLEIKSSELRELELRLEAEQSGVNDEKSECIRRKTALDEREAALDGREAEIKQAEHDAGL